jgi:nucleoside-diphosphate-sugar epimerase
MRILVTGASGFLGSRVVERLRADGHEVIGTDRSGAVARAGDLAEPEFTASLPDVEAVVHCAAVQYVTPTIPRFRRAGWFERNNVAATRNLRSRYDGRVRYFLLVGTSMMYRQDGRAIYSTTAPLQGQGVYSESKLAAYELVEGMQNDVGVMLPCIIGGPGREGFFRSFTTTMTRWGFAVRPGSGRHPTHVVHVDDAAELIRLMVRNGATGKFNAGGTQPLTIDQWIEEIRDELGLPEVRRVPVPYFLLAVGAWVTRYRILAREQLLMLGHPHVLDISDSLALGWTPRSNRQIVRDTARHIASGAARRSETEAR